jgi:glutaredoxin 3
MKLKELIIYSTPACGYCNILKGWLTENKVPYQDYNVATDVAKRQEMIEKSGFLGVPVSRLVFEKDGKTTEEIVVGFDKGRMSQLLGINAF